MLQHDIIPELNTGTCLYEKYNCSFTYCKLERKKKRKADFYLREADNESQVNMVHLQKRIGATKVSNIP